MGLGGTWIEFDDSQPFVETAIYEQTIEPQFKRGILDADGLALIAEYLNLPECYIAGGYEDYRCFLRQLQVRDRPYRAQLIVRDYEPHFLTLDVYLPLSPRELYMLVLDSTPDHPNHAHKWLMAIKAELPDWKVRLYANQEKIQSDDFSCKLFAINFAKRLIKLDPVKLYSDLEMISFYSNEIRLLPEHGLPPTLMKDTQSLSRLRLYPEAHWNLWPREYRCHPCDQHPASSAQSYRTQGERIWDDLKRLANFIQKHTVTVITDYPNMTLMKPQNRSIDHSISDYRSTVLSWCAKLTWGQIKLIIERRLGLHWIGQVPNPRYHLQVCPNGMIELQLPYSTNLSTPPESPWPESETTIFYRKPIEIDYSAQVPWSRYKIRLQHQHRPSRTWIQLDRYGLHYHIGTHITIRGTSTEMRRFIGEIIQMNPIVLIKFGCSQVRATVDLLTWVRHNLVDDSTLPCEQRCALP